MCNSPGDGHVQRGGRQHGRMFSVVGAQDVLEAEEMSAGELESNWGQSWRSLICYSLKVECFLFSVLRD